MHGMCDYIISAFSALEEMSHAPMMMYACIFNFVAMVFSEKETQTAPLQTSRENNREIAQ